MPSPFPGMDPYLERPELFGGFHERFVNAISDAISGQLPPTYFAELGSRIWIEESSRVILPDVNIHGESGPHRSHGSSGGTAVLAPASDVEVEPFTIVLEEHKETFLEIRHGADGVRLVTAIELLSPTNKAAGGDGRNQYLQKQDEMRRSDVNFIEIDLLRGGQKSTLAPSTGLRTPHGECTYHIVLRPAERRFQRDVYRIHLWNRLPTLHIPLLPGDGILAVPLQPVFDRCYELGRYAMRIDYTAPLPLPPLRPHEAECVARMSVGGSAAAGDATALPTTSS